MNKNEYTACQLNQQIEKDYISNMLGITEQSIEHIAEQDAVQNEVIDFNQAYKNPDFECRIFNIAGLNIAVASESIADTICQQTILQNDNDQTQPGLLAGTISTDDKIIQVINLEFLVMNGIGDAGKVIAGNKPVDIVLLKGSGTGFIGDTPVDTKTISKQDVHWRDDNSKRIWLAGTVAQMGIALLDIEGVISLLDHDTK